MGTKTKAGKYFLTGLLVDFCILLLASVGLLMMAAQAYDGKCGLGIIFGSGRTDCTFYEYLTNDMILVLTVYTVYASWAVVPLLVLPPLLGYLIGRRTPSAAAPVLK